MVCLADVTVFGLYMSFWYPDTPRWIWVLSIVCFICAINLCSVKVFGELEFWLSLLKVGAIIAMVVGFGLDQMGRVPIGEASTRILLYAWLMVAIPVGLAIIVSVVAPP
ncbi:hypothetical protein G6F68_020977 [Rhizopus microsporus]|nr:hypothetical protein G6F68_020977 [Rhizopus microsporus]